MTDRLLGLLENVPDEPDTSRGYLDLLGESGAAPDTLAQRLMRSPLVAGIYEDLWRPVLFGLSKGGPFGPGTEQEQALAREWLGLPRNPDAAVLDVACGPGNVSRALATGLSPRGLVVGIDASASMLERAAREPAERIAYVRGDAADLPFRAGCFDAVCCFGALYLFADPWAALDGMARVLRPGGRIVFLTSRWPQTPPVALHAGAVFRRLTGIRPMSYAEVRAALAARGFTDLRHRACGLMQFIGATRQS